MFLHPAVCYIFALLRHIRSSKVHTMGQAVILFLERKRIKKNFNLAPWSLLPFSFPHGNESACKEEHKT